MIKDCRKKSSKVWHRNLMEEIRNKSEIMMIPFILDIEQVCTALRKLPDPNRNVSRCIKSLLKINIENDVYRNNDLDKVHEILNALEGYAKSAL